jgi:exodeoxyribonuclease V alpha subunit
VLEISVSIIEMDFSDRRLSDTGTKNDPSRPYELWQAGFAGKPEKSQVLTPYRGELFGIEAINPAIQGYVGEGMLDRIGVLDGITFFDKVIQVRNPPRSDMAYAYNTTARRPERIEVFNGELGFVKPHGFDNKDWKWKRDFWLKRFQIVFSRKENWWVNCGSDIGGPPQPVEENLELAYAISVHKAQGSEFERTYVVIPRLRASFLSPELFYTALTRASRHCTLFLQQDISVLVDMRRREKSHLLQINSSLFTSRRVPEPLLNLGTWYEEGKIHETLAGYIVRSKSEVIIANLLSAAKLPFRYEVPLFAPDGTFYLPDFTIEWRGRKFFWEHAGLLSKPKYKKDWEAKQKWYNKHFRGSLLVTEESPKLTKAAQKIIETTFR